MSYFHFSRITAIFCLLVGLFIIPFSAGQDLSAMSMEENDAEADAIDPFKISVNVNEVSLDVVVVDGNGHPITDLTADDFEVYQDKLPQEVTSSVYISNQVEETARPVVSLKDAPNLSPFSVPGTTLKKEDVRRTIVFVLDNLGKFETTYFSKMAIRRFGEQQMQPGDLIAIMRTGEGACQRSIFTDTSGVRAPESCAANLCAGRQLQHADNAL